MCQGGPRDHKLFVSFPPQGLLHFAFFCCAYLFPHAKPIRFELPPSASAAAAVFLLHLCGGSPRAGVAAGAAAACAEAAADSIGRARLMAQLVRWTDPLQPLVRKRPRETAEAAPVKGGVAWAIAPTVCFGRCI
jgi:hypothetical protein